MFAAGQAGAQPASGRHVTPLPESLKALVAVADAVDYAYAVVGNE